MQLKMESRITQGKLSEGMLLVDKPTGVSSHRVVNWARRLSGIKKVGHTGTLDPLATGLLIVLIGRKFTKQQEQYLKQDKEYLCTARLGLTTDSYDIDGDVIGTADWENVAHITKDQIIGIMTQFQGDIQQRVPIFSAVKRSGKKLYELAREAKHDLQAKYQAEQILADLPERTVHIFELELVSLTQDTAQHMVEFQFRVHCSSGTYIRSLAHDIGQELGVGATVTALRRTKIGSHSVTQAKLCPVFF